MADINSTSKQASEFILFREMEVIIGDCSFCPLTCFSWLCSQNGIIAPVSCIGDIQSLLLSVMCNVASILVWKKSSGLVIADQVERCCFVNATIAFCKLQHLNPTTAIKTQVSLTTLVKK